MQQRHPEVYAWMYDQYLVWFKKQSPHFYHGIAPIDGLTKEELNEVNQRRKEWGIPGLDAFSIEKVGQHGLSFSKLY